MDDKARLRGQKNTGPTIADRLERVGLTTLGDLKKISPGKAFNLVKDTYPDVTIPVCYYLYALQGRLSASIGTICPRPPRVGFLMRLV